MGDQLSLALRVLRRAGIRLDSGDLSSLAIRLPNGESRTVAIRAGLPTEHQPRSTGTARPLYVVKAVDDALRQRATQGDIDVVTIEPAELIIAGQTLHRDLPSASAPLRRRRGRVPWGRYALERILAGTGTPMMQGELADACDLTQQAVSEALGHLRNHVVHSNEGWLAADRGLLIESWLSAYPGPGGATTHWYSLEAPAIQARKAAELASELGAAPLVSGDAAADVIAPWRQPSTTRIYMREIVDFTDVGFSPADPDDATLAATVPDDPTLWRTAQAWPRSGVALADPLIVLWDVLHSGGADVLDAVQHLRLAIESRPAGVM